MPCVYVADVVPFHLDAVDCKDTSMDEHACVEEQDMVVRKEGEDDVHHEDDDENIDQEREGKYLLTCVWSLFRVLSVLVVIAHLSL